MRLKNEKNWKGKQALLQESEGQVMSRSTSGGLAVGEGAVRDKPEIQRRRVKRKAAVKRESTRTGVATTTVYGRYASPATAILISNEPRKHSSMKQIVDLFKENNN